jgi:hypothetical protein
VPEFGLNCFSPVVVPTLSNVAAYARLDLVLTNRIKGFFSNSRGGFSYTFIRYLMKCL